MSKKLFTIAIFALLAGATYAQPPIDRIPQSLTLPEHYPESWLFAHDLNYDSAIVGKYIILDVAATSHQHKGQFQAAQLASFAESKRRSELYVAETFYARGGRGERTDVLTVYEKTQLKPVAEVILPDKKRALMVPHKGVMQLTNDEKFLLIFNFTPATSVTVLDIDERKVVSEVPIPGCTLIYPSGQRGFSSLCANGTLASFVLGKDGEVVNEYISRAFNDIDNDVLYMNPAMIKGVAYFPTATGNVQALDLNRDQPLILAPWSLVSKPQAADGWRAAEGQSVTSSSSGLLYVHMHQVASDGSRLADSSEIWVFDPSTQKRHLRITLKNKNIGAIEVTRGKSPYLVATSGEGFDVYNAQNGQYIRTIGGWWPGTGHGLMFASE